MKLCLFLYLIFSLPLYASVELDIPTIKEEEQTLYSNFPTINQFFKGAKNRQEKEAAIQKCQDWIMEESKLISTNKIFKSWCAVKTDVIIREYLITAHIVLKI